MRQLIDYFENATIGEFILGLFVGAVVIKIIIEILFED